MSNCNEPIGFIYVLTNPFMPGLLKIGYTERNPCQRATELSADTGIPAPFEVAFYFSRVPRQMEGRVLKALGLHRVNSRCEFFQLSISAARQIISQHLPDASSSEETPMTLFDTFDTTAPILKMVLTCRNPDFESGVKDGRTWPIDAEKPIEAEKWQIDCVRGFKEPTTWTDRHFLSRMQEVIGDCLKSSHSSEYAIGFYSGVLDAVYDEERKRLERLDALYATEP